MDEREREAAAHAVDVLDRCISRLLNANREAHPTADGVDLDAIEPGFVYMAKWGRHTDHAVKIEAVNVHRCEHGERRDFVSRCVVDGDLWEW